MKKIISNTAKRFADTSENRSTSATAKQLHLARCMVKSSLAAAATGLMLISTSASAFDGIETSRVDQVTHQWADTGLSAEAKSSGRLLAQAVTINGLDHGLPRLSNDGSQVFFQEWNNDTHDYGETMDIIALPNNLQAMGVDGHSGLVYMAHGSLDLNNTLTVYSSPLIFAQVTSYYGGDAFSVQINSHPSSGYAELRTGESTAYDGAHTTEDIDFAVIEEGSYDLGDGRMLHALSTNQGFLDLSAESITGNAAVVCQAQQIRPDCSNSCSEEDMNYEPLDYNGTRLEKTFDGNGNLQSISAHQFYNTPFDPRIACLIVEDQHIEMYVSGRKLYITGTKADEQITLRHSGNSSDGVSVSYATTDYSGSEDFFGDTGITSVVVSLGGGNDILNASQLDIPVIAFGNHGDDILIGGSAADSLKGDGGNDTLHGGEAVDSLDGGAGDDILYAANDQDTLDCGAHYDEVYVTNGVTLLDIAPNSTDCEHFLAEVESPRFDLVTIETADGTYLSSPSQGSVKTTATNGTGYSLATVAGETCIKDGDTIRLLSEHDHYLRSIRSNDLEARANTTGSWAQFVVTNHTDNTNCLASGDEISLFNNHFNRYWRADAWIGKPTGNVSVSGTALNDREKFIIRDSLVVAEDNGPVVPVGPVNTLARNSRLNVDDTLISESGQYILKMQSDGNLVIYSNGQPIWASNTFGSHYAILQGDNNFCINNTSDDSYVMCVGTAGASGVTELVMQDDGNLVLYAGNGPVWASMHGTIPENF